MQHGVTVQTGVAMDTVLNYSVTLFIHLSLKLLLFKWLPVTPAGLTLGGLSWTKLDHCFWFCVNQVKPAAQQDRRPGPKDAQDGSRRQDLG